MSILLCCRRINIRQIFRRVFRRHSHAHCHGAAGHARPASTHQQRTTRASARAQLLSAALLAKHNTHAKYTREGRARHEHTENKKRKKNSFTLSAASARLASCICPLAGHLRVTRTMLFDKEDTKQTQQHTQPRTHTRHIFTLGLKFLVICTLGTLVRDNMLRGTVCKNTNTNTNTVQAFFGKTCIFHTRCFVNYCFFFLGDKRLPKSNSSTGQRAPTRSTRAPP